jgi:hypothetical protein
MSTNKDQEWISLKNKQWTEKDGTSHNISDYQLFHGCFTYTIIATMPITNEQFYYSFRFMPDELTNSNIEKISKIGKEHLLKCMLNELTLKK